MPDIDIFSPILHCLNQRAAALGHPETWGWVLNDTVVGCFTPALFLLDQEGCINLADGLRKTSHDLYWTNTSYWIRRERQLSRVLSLLDQAHIQAIPLKGAALLETIYHKFGVRLMTDIDILVRPKDFLKAAEILLSSGMHPKWQYPSGDLFEFVQMPGEFWPGELSFKNSHRLRIDLHQNLVTYHWFKIAFPVDIDQVWGRCSQMAEDQDRIWRTRLSPYDMLAHMCLHLALHGLHVIKNFFDIDLWLRHLSADWDWSQYIAISQEWQLGSVSHHVFTFCREFFNTPIPDQIINTLKPSRFDRWQVRALVSPQSVIENRRTLGKRFPSLVKFALFENSRIKFKTLKYLVFPTHSWLENNPDSRRLLGHWSHILIVLLRGD